MKLACKMPLLITIIKTIVIFDYQCSIVISPNDIYTCKEIDIFVCD